MAEKRLIDANTLKAKAFADPDSGEAMVYLQDIDESPTVDAVKVVRCKDCEYWGDEAGVAVRTDGVRFARCKVHNLCVRGKNIGWCPTEDDFCSQGERRTDNENR